MDLFFDNNLIKIIVGIRNIINLLHLKSFVDVLK